MRETEIVERIREMAGSVREQRQIIRGIGDDCAILRPRRNEDLVFTTDFVLEDRHFTLDTYKPAQIGHKALARGLSDLAAMGSEPLFCLVSLAVPRNIPPGWIDGFYKGLLTLAKRYKISLAGGDLSEFDKVVADVMCCGRVRHGQAILRSGAKPGDHIFVTGKLGGAAHGHWRQKIAPRIEQGLLLRGRVSAGMDISDGLSLDLQRLCLESRVRADLDRSAIPIARGATLDEALHGGEDYELLFTASAKTVLPKVSATRIGVIAKGKSGEVRLDGELLKARGFDHFASR